MNKKKIGIIGCGVVGTELINQFVKNFKSSYEIEIVLVKNINKERNVPSWINFTNNSQEFLSKSLDVVIDVSSSSLNYMKDEIFDKIYENRYSKTVYISASKKFVSTFLEEIIQLNSYGANIYYNAAVCGNLDVFNVLEFSENNSEFLLNGIENQTLELKGILNTTSNFLLQNSTKLNWEAALSEAVKLGIAETSPAYDVCGLDARDKLQILVLHTFGLLIDKRDIKIETLYDLYFDEKKDKIENVRQIALAKFINGKLYCSIKNEIVEDELLLSARQTRNAIKISSRNKSITIFGTGAGALATTEAIIEDLKFFEQGLKYSYSRFSGVLVA
jgi:homoserine dehydrogenase